jgi:hypothetical protein
MHRTWIGVMAALAMMGPAPAASDAMPRDPGATLRAVEDAVGRGDLAAAERLRWALHREALAGRRWTAWLLAGDAARAVGRGAPDPRPLRIAERMSGARHAPEIGRLRLTADRLRRPARLHISHGGIDP